MQDGRSVGGHPREEHLVLQKAALAKEVEEWREKLAASEKAHVEAERKKAKEIATASSEAIEAYRSSKELRSYILDRLVDDQLAWEVELVKFNPTLKINFDTCDTPPPQPIPYASPVDTKGEAIAIEVENAADEAQGRDAEA